MANSKTYIKRMNHNEVIAAFEPAVTIFRTANPIPGALPGCVDSPEELWEIHLGFKTAQVDAGSGNYLHAQLRDLLRPKYNEAMINFTDFVELMSRKDPTLPTKLKLDFVLKGGKTARAKVQSSLAPSLSVSTDHTEPCTVSTKLNGRMLKGVVMEYTYGDPTLESNWQHILSSGSSKNVLKNLESGKRCSFRARFIGSKENSPWSNYVTLTVP